MYTRSFSTRRSPTHRPLPPDYGGTALTIPHADDAPPEGTPRPAVTPPPPNHTFGGRPRRPLSSRGEFLSPPRPEAPPPFGGGGQTPPEQRREAKPPFEPRWREDASPEDRKGEEIEVASTHTSPLGHFFDPANLKSDDLLLLGLALLFLNDKDRPEGLLANDALLLLAALYLSGL